RECERFRRQARLIAQVAEPISEFLNEAPPALLGRLPSANAIEERDVLQALIDLKADTSSVVRPLLETNQLSARELAIESLAFSTDPKIGEWLCAKVGGGKKPRQSASSVRAMLKALRQFPSDDAEALLLRGTRDSCVEIRAVAIGGLG